ncbi:MAG TPA: response regulator [Burkholderiaceae bacterium]
MPASRLLGPGFASTIRARIQWLVVACTVPMFLLAVLWLVLSYQRGREALLHTNLQAARNVVQAVDREIDAAIQVLHALSTAASIDEGDYRRFHERARLTLRYVGADNIVLLDTELNGLASAVHDWGAPLPKVRQDRFPHVLSSGKPAVSDVFVGQVSGKLQAAVAVPVVRDDRVVARLEMVFDLRRFADLLARQNFAPQWTAAVLDSQSVIVARSRDPQAFVGKTVPPVLLNQLKSAQEGSFEGYTADGSYVVATFSRASAHGWAVAIGVPVSELTAQLQRSLWQAGAGTALLLVAGLLLARAIGRGIASPIQALVQPALAIGRGEAAAVAPSSLHEASELGRALQQAQKLLLLREQARQQAEASVHASQSRLQMALDSAQIGDWDIDLRSGAIRHSLQHDRCYGYTEAATDWSAERFFQCVHPDDRERIRRHIKQTLQERTSWLDEYRVVWPDGSVHWLTTRGTFLSSAGEPGFVVGVVIETTARRQAEELRLHSARLEAENRQIQEANRLKNEFLANMSHELRTPLNAVIGFADILRASGAHLPEEKRGDYLGHIASSGRHLLRLINDVLDLSKVESGRFDLLPEPVLLQQVADEVAGVLRAEAARKDVQLQMQIDPALTDLVLDPARLRQMIYNLLSNAIKFTGAGGRVVMRAMPQGERELRIEVEDNGIGIAHADQPKLFRQFQQVHSGLAKTHPGTGLGLALTRHLAELHGGSVGVRSTPGVGSVFHLVLPRRLRAAAARADAAGEPPAPDAPTVLVIEDDRADQTELARILRAAGYQVEVAGTAQQALQMAATRRYDAITLDLLLPDRSGLEVLNEVRAGGFNSEVPVVVITMVTQASALAGIVVSDVLTKPIRQHEVNAALRRLRRSDGRALRVLVVDDDPVALEQMAATLQTLGMTALLAPSGALALEALDRQAPDAMVLDLLMQGMNGFDLLHELRQRPHLESLPVFVWTQMRLSADELATLSRSARAVVDKLDGGLPKLAQQLRAWQAQQAQKEAA